MTAKLDASACLDDEALALLLDGGLEEAEERATRAHLDTCDDCRSLFADAARAAAKTSAPKAPVFARGEVLAGKYRLERVLGTGGMGHVFAARHLDLDQLVALKIMKPSLSLDADATRRFAREARAAAALRSEHSVRIHDVGKLEGGAPYIVMEHLEGEDLARLLETHERGLPIHDAVDYILQACDALAEAHGLGIVHRDLKPHNLFLTRGTNGRAWIKVLDFGLSKALAPPDGPQESAMTATNVMLGSPLYASPEQLQSARDADRRTDLWSLGATLHHLLTGVPAFFAPNVHLVCARILTEPPPPLAHRRPDAPAELERIVRRCMERNLDARYPHVHALTADLRAFLGPSSARAVIGPSVPPAPVLLAPVSTAILHPAVASPSSPAPPMLSPRTSTSTDWPVANTLPPSPRTSWSAIALVLLCLVVGASGFAAYLLRSHGQTTTSAPTPVPAAPIERDEPTTTSAESAPPPPAAVEPPPAPMPSARPTAPAPPPRVTPARRRPAPRATPAPPGSEVDPYARP